MVVDRTLGLAYGSDMPFDYLNANEAAERAGVSRRTITRWIESERLKPAAQLPGATGALLFLPADVDNAKDLESALASPEGAEA